MARSTSAKPNADIVRLHADLVFIASAQGTLVRVLMSMGDRYELAGTTISVGFREVQATFQFPERDMAKVREIAKVFDE